MATLNVTAVLLGGDIASPFTVLRRKETVDSKGRSSLAVESIKASGVVTSGNPNDLTREDMYQVASRSITVVTKFPLRGESTTYQPDVIFWYGDYYLVGQIDYYPQYGPGFVQVECSSMDKTDSIIAGLLGAASLSFNQGSNSQYLPMIG